MLVNDMLINPFWTTPCPVRGAAQTHTHSYGCNDHLPNQCCHCFETADGVYPTREVPTFAAMPPVDIEARLNGSGPVLVTKEAKWARGIYPGPDTDPGRGELTEFQQRYLTLVRNTVLEP